MPIKQVLVVAGLAALLWAPAAPMLAETPPADDPLAPSYQRGEAYARMMRAMLAARRGEFSAAAEELRQAIELQPESPELLIEAADLLLWTGRRSEAEKVARQAQKVDPQHPRVRRFLAELAASRALGARRDPAAREEAIRLYEELAAEDGTDTEVV